MWCLSAIILLLAVPLRAAGAPPVLKVAARTFAIYPQVGWPAASRTPQGVKEVIGDLKNTVVLLDYGSTRICFVTSSLGIQGGEVERGGLNIATRQVAAQALGLSTDQIILAGSHNHTVPTVGVDNPEEWGKPGAAPKDGVNEATRQFLEGLARTLKGLEKDLVPVTVEWGTAKETRVTYNRRGHRPNGKSYFIREEDRVKLGKDFVGEIDPDASIVVFRKENGIPAAAFAFFTGHPITGYNPENMVAFGQWSQVASQKLSAHLGEIPVAFLQGCAGDINSKYLLTGTIQQAIEMGGWLGDSYIEASKNLHRSERPGLQWSREKVKVPHGPLPPLADLEKDLASIDDFIRRGNAGDPNTLECVGMNFPVALTPAYRAKLVDMVRPWYVWAIEQHKTGKAGDVAKFLPMDIVVARIGDVGFVGLPFESFVRTGFKIKRETPLPCVLTCGYTGDTSGGTYGYIPDASAVNDREYQAGFFRYMAKMPPYKAPAADAAATVAVAKLTEYAKK